MNHTAIVPLHVLCKFSIVWFDQMLYKITSLILEAIFIYKYKHHSLNCPFFSCTCLTLKMTLGLITSGNN